MALIVGASGHGDHLSVVCDRLDGSGDGSERTARVTHGRDCAA
jgi:hypothetical protein